MPRRAQVLQRRQRGAVLLIETVPTVVSFSVQTCPAPLANRECHAAGEARRARIEYWRLKFEQLRDLRVTEAEQELQLEKSRAQDAEAESADGRAARGAARGRVGRGRRERDAEAEAGAVDALKAKLERQASVIEAYQQLTSICIRADERGHSCTAINHLQRRALRFHLEDSAPTSGTRRRSSSSRPATFSGCPSAFASRRASRTKQAPLLRRRILLALPSDGEEAA